MFGNFIILFRESLEAALIVGILISYLTRIRANENKKYIYLGALAGITVSIIFALLFQRFFRGFEGKTEDLFEGIVMFTAAGILTSMILWMRRIGTGIRHSLESQIDKALARGQLILLFSFAFIAILREGVETVLFLNALYFSQATGLSFLVRYLSAGSGIFAAVLLVILFFKSMLKISIKSFFSVTSVLLILIAAGMFAGAVHEFQEVGLIPIIIEHIWDVNWLLDEKGVIGSILKELVGYNGNPALLETILYACYLALTLFFMRPTMKIAKSDE